jgi:hypothetical protein
MIRPLRAVNRKRLTTLLAGIGLLTLASGSARAATESIGLNLALTDFDAPSSEEFTLNSQPLNLTGQYLATLSIVGSLEDARGDGVSALFNTRPMLVQASIDGIAILDVGPEAPSAGPYGPYSVSTIVNASDFGGTINAMQFVLSFKASGNSDKYQFNTTFKLEEIPAVPVPSAAGMGMVVLAGMGIAALVRRRVARS